MLILTKTKGIRPLRSIRSKINFKIHPNSSYQMTFFQLRHLHQDYYHPNDVPIYQTPTLGAAEGPRKKVLPEDFIFPLSNIDLRYPEAKKPFTDSPKDNPRESIQQAPEMFLPEEPTFFEFWGFYPFAVFAGAFFLSKEFFVLSGQGHASAVLVFSSIALIGTIWQLSSNFFLENRQFQIDRHWSIVTSVRKNLDLAIKLCQENLKTKKRAEQFDAYLKHLTRQQVAFFAFKRKEEQTRRLLEILNQIKQSEESLLKQSNKSGMDFDMNELEKHINKDETIKKDWEEKVFSFLANAKDGGEISSDDKVRQKMDKIIKDSKKDEKEDIGIKTTIQSYLNLIYSSLKSLKVYSGPRETPENVNLEDIELEMKGKGKMISTEEIRRNQLRLVDEQTARFKKERVPDSLLRLRRKIEKM